eukprot:16124494-Heterocapsa_arctica.AAC.1
MKLILIFKKKKMNNNKSKRKCSSPKRKCSSPNRKYSSPWSPLPGRPGKESAHSARPAGRLAGGPVRPAAAALRRRFFCENESLEPGERVTHVRERERGLGQPARQAKRTRCTV